MRSHHSLFSALFLEFLTGALDIHRLTLSGTIQGGGFTYLCTQLVSGSVKV